MSFFKKEEKGSQVLENAKKSAGLLIYAESNCHPTYFKWCLGVGLTHEQSLFSLLGRNVVKKQSNKLRAIAK